jgi:hypothetical protein
MAESTKTQEKDEPKAARGKDAGQAEVQAMFDEAAEKGYFGYTPDETPNENYTLQTPPDAPTPETTRVHPNKAARQGKVR